MKARILPLDDIGGTVVLMLSINPTEADILSDYMADENHAPIPVAVRMMAGYLDVIAGNRGKTTQDVVNTDGRLLPANAAQLRDRKDAEELWNKGNRPEGTTRGIHNLPGLHG